MISPLEDNGAAVTRKASKTKAALSKSSILPYLREKHYYGPTSLDDINTQGFRYKKLLCIVHPVDQINTLQKAWYIEKGYIGRGPSHDLVIKVNDKSLEPEHVKITVEGDEYKLQDNQTKCGTFLILLPTRTGQPSRDGYRLCEGDSFFIASVIEIRVEKIEYEMIKDVNNYIDKNFEINERTSRKVSFKFFEEDKVSVTVKRKPKEIDIATLISLQVYVGGKKKLEYTIKDKSECLIGSKAYNNISLNMEGVQPVHCKIEHDGFEFKLRDLSYSHKNGTKVLLRHPTNVIEGDVISLGGCQLVVTDIDSAFGLGEDFVDKSALQVHTSRACHRKKLCHNSFEPGYLLIEPNKEIHVGRSIDCDIPIQSMLMKPVNFSISFQCGYLSISPASITKNQGVYLQIGRNQRKQEWNKKDFSQLTSKAHHLVLDTVFKIGASEFQVASVKVETFREIIEKSRLEEDIIPLLKRVELFSQLSNEMQELHSIASSCKKRYLQKGELIYHQGDMALNFYILASGQVELFCARNTKQNDENYGSEKSIHVASLQAGSYFGEVCLLQNQQYTSTALAVDDVECLVISRDDFVDVIHPLRDIILPQLCTQVDDRILHYLQQVPMLNKLKYNNLRVIAEKFQETYFLKGEYLIKEGDQGEHLRFFLIISGNIEITKSIGIHQVQVALIGPGNYIGEISIMNCTPTNANAIAFTNVQALVMSKKNFCDLIQPLLNQDLQVEAKRRQRNTILITTLKESDPTVKVDLSKYVNASTDYRKQNIYVHKKDLQVDSTAKDRLLAKNSAVREDAEDFSEFVGHDSESKQKKLRDALARVRSDADHDHYLIIRAISGPHRGDVHIIEKYARIGNLTGNATIQLNDVNVSDNHATIEYKNGNYWLYDSLSEWGTYVRIDVDENCVLQVGDQFVCGEIVFKCLGHYRNRKNHKKNPSCTVQ